MHTHRHRRLLILMLLAVALVFALSLTRKVTNTGKITVSFMGYTNASNQRLALISITNHDRLPIAYYAVLIEVEGNRVLKNAVLYPDFRPFSNVAFAVVTGCQRKIAVGIPPGAGRWRVYLCYGQLNFMEKVEAIASQQSWLPQWFRPVLPKLPPVVEIKSDWLTP